MPKLRKLQRSFARNFLSTLLSTPALATGAFAAELLRYISGRRALKDLDITDVASMYAATNLPLVRYLAAQINRENPDVTIVPDLGVEAKDLPGFIPLVTDKDIGRVLWMSMALNKPFSAIPSATPRIKGKYPFKLGALFSRGTQFWTKGIEDPNSPLVLLGGPLTRLGIVAHELGHTTQEYEEEPLTGEDVTGAGFVLGGMIGRPEVTGAASMAGMALGEKKIQREAEATRIGLEALRRIGLKPRAMEREEERLKDALGTYESSRLYHLGGLLAVPIQYINKRLLRRWI